MIRNWTEEYKKEVYRVNAFYLAQLNDIKSNIDNLKTLIRKMIVML